MRSIILLPLAMACFAQNAQFQPVIPRVWDEKAILEMELPLATPSASPVYPGAGYYYSIPEIVIYKTYSAIPPAGMTEDEYTAWLQKQEPEVAFDPARLHTRQDWIDAGERVFFAGATYTTEATRVGRNQWRPWVVRRKGELEKGLSACASCHVQVRNDGTTIPGAPFYSTTFNGRAFRPAMEGEQLRLFNLGLKRDFATPWLDPDPNARFDLAGMVKLRNAMVPRQGTSFLSPQPIPDLIGIKDRKYLDHTGLEQHRSVVDFMRYAALNTNGASIQMLGNYAGFIPGGTDFKTLPDPKSLVRYSDAQLFALTMYVYSLKPPPNPNQPNALSLRGSNVFRREGCVGCHTPPLYTNNKLTPVRGFQVPEEHRAQYDILPVVVGTDPYLAMNTRRGTGYYKVPSLKGLWYRGPFTHDGSVATLEDWFDEGRLRDDYSPTGFKGWPPTHAVKGHEFGLRMSAEDKKALIAFLLTL